MNNPSKLVGQTVERNGISFPIEETTISRGKQTGEPRYVVAAVADLSTLITFLGEDVVKDSLEAVIRRASLDAHSACDVTIKDKNGVETTNFEDENYVSNFNSALEGGAGEGEKALREQRDALNSKFRDITNELLAAYTSAMATGEAVNVDSFNDRLTPLTLRIQAIDAQLAAKVAAREAKKNK